METKTAKLRFYILCSLYAVYYVIVLLFSNTAAFILLSGLREGNVFMFFFSNMHSYVNDQSQTPLT